MATKTNFKVVIKAGGRTYEAKGPTILEAFKQLPVIRRFIGAGTLVVTKGKQEVTRVMFPRHLAQVFSHQELTKNMWAKMLTANLQ